ncbi:MAG: hypothetical protein ACK56I_00845, partial [bacterium]
MIPEGLRGSGPNHFTRCATFQFADTSLRSLLPRGIRLKDARVTIRLLELPSELSLGLFLEVISHHGRWDTIPMKDKGQGFMGLAFALHRVSSRPSKGCGID